MQLSPLQSRLAASLLASVLLILLYLTLFSPQFALAQEIPGEDSRRRHDGLALAPRNEDGLEDRLHPRAAAVVDYEPEFNAFDRSIIGRAPPGVTALTNNVPQALNVQPGGSRVFVFEKAAVSGREDRLELRRRDRSDDGAQGSETEDDEQDGAESEVQLLRRQDASRAVYISANTCMQPQPVPDTTRMQAPQLTMYISSTYVAPQPEQRQQRQQPTMGDSVPPNSTWHVFNEGAVMVNFTSAEDVFIQISAPTLHEDLAGVWNFEVAASVDGPYHRFSDVPTADLVWVDSDAKAALLQTKDLASPSDSSAAIEKVMSQQSSAMPYVMFAHNGGDSAIDGVRYSYCGLQTYAQVAVNRAGKLSSLIQTSMTRRGPGNLPRQQFYVSGLNSSSSYSGILATATRSNSAGGGGLVFRSTNFTTRQDGGNCALIPNLEFCRDQVTYAVPSNDRKLNASELTKFYDDYTRKAMGNFEKVLAQIQCETSSTERYSLVRGCDDCRNAYKDWLCLVSIPRCEDFRSDKDYLQPRNIDKKFPDGRNLTEAEWRGLDISKATLGSRNPEIDTVVSPGPYKELLPCDSICYNIVQSCPSSMGFACPVPGLTHSFKGSYFVNETAPDGGFKCNFPGRSLAKVSAATRGRLAAPPSVASLLIYGVGSIAAAGLVLV